MKTNVNKKSGKLFGLAAVLMLAAMMIGGCKQAQGNSSREKKYEVTVSAGSNGKVTVAPEVPTDKKVTKGQELTITATANTGYKVDTWTVTPHSTLQSGSLYFFFHCILDIFNYRSYFLLNILYNRYYLFRCLFYFFCHIFLNFF
mgnify:CR=1 FL=1